MSKTIAKAQYHLNTRKAALPLQAGQANTYKAVPGEAYRVLKRAEGAAGDELASDVLAQRSGSDLQLDYADGTRITLQDYFTECLGDAACSVTLAGDAPEGWELTAGAKDGASLADGSSLLYAHGSPEALASMAGSHPGLEQPLAGLQGNLRTYLPQESSGMGWIAGGTGLGALMASGGGGGGGGGATAAVAVQNFVKLSFVGGPALDGNDLSVEVYSADGKTLLGTGKLAADGSVTVNVKDYQGVVVVKLLNTGGANDYLDEATGLGKDLGTQLYSMGVISAPNSTINLNVNVLTTIAYVKAQEGVGGTPDNPAVLSAQQVSDTAKAISAVFQIEDVLRTSAVATNGGNYNAADGLSAGEKYGSVLAAFSGADKLGAGNVQQTLDKVLAGITISGGQAAITNESQALLVEGAKVANVPGGSSNDPSGGVSGIVDTYAPVFSSSGTASVYEHIGEGKVVYTAVASDPSAFAYSLAGDDASAFRIDPQTGAVTLIGDPDFATKSSYSFKVVATDAAGNTSSQDIALDVKLAEPIIQKLVVESGSFNIGDVVTATITISGDSGVPLSSISGTVNGFALGNLTRVNSTTYTATFTVSSGGVDIAEGESIPVSFSLGDGASRNTPVYNQSNKEAQPIVDNSTTSYELYVDSDADAADIVRLGLNATHTYKGDLIILLVAPNGSQVTLFSQQGGGADDFVNTYFTTGGANLSTGVGAFTGSFAPEQGFDGLSGAARGTWTLVVKDVQASDAGVLSNWSLTLPDYTGSMIATEGSTVIDANAPLLLSSSPQDDAESAVASANLTLTFGENIQAGTGSIRIVNNDNPADTRLIDINDGTQISINGKVLVINPSNDLLAGGNYHIEIDGSALHDAAGNNYAGISSSDSLNFTVAAAAASQLLVTDGGVFVDSNGDGMLDAGEAQLIRLDQGQWVYTAAATGSTEQTAGALGAAIGINGLQDGAGHAIAFADGEWTVTFLSVTGPKLDLAGFGADDKIVVDMSEATVSGNQFAMGQDLGVLEEGRWVGDRWGWDDSELPSDAWGKVTHYPYDYSAGVEEASLEVSLGESITAHYEVINRPGDNRSGDITLAINLPTNYLYDFLLPAAD